MLFPNLHPFIDFGDDVCGHFRIPAGVELKGTSKLPQVTTNSEPTTLQHYTSRGSNFKSATAFPRLPNPRHRLRALSPRPSTQKPPPRPEPTPWITFLTVLPVLTMSSNQTIKTVLRGRIEDPTSTLEIHLQTDRASVP